MIILYDIFRKRIPVQERVSEVVVFTVDNYLETNNDASRMIINGLGEDTYHRIIKILKENTNLKFVVCDFNRKLFFTYEEYEDVLIRYKTFKMFSKDERSGFKYWFAHWCAFQLTALNLGIWKFKYLFHDIEKPWMKLWYRGNYSKVQKFHRKHNKHHLEYGRLHGFDKMDWEALIIDWECCGLTKQKAQLDARETMEYELTRDKWKPYANEIESYLKIRLNVLGL